ncbi:cytochrome P450 monooxygenase-like protein [Phyllosticta citrichinensis]|uniref:Cytochrome P450 monooxygenase-like protein n=1 Tax=Phyllosticta citrichinensis TaxID=1130410 RepID=A0ABR1Y8V7_9PEZI
MSLILFALLGALVYVLVTAYRSRKVVNDLRKQGLLSGHMLVVKENLEKFPIDAVHNYSFARMSQAFRKDNMFYLDFWPISTPFLVITNPYTASQITQNVSAEKPEAVTSAFVAMTGGPNLLSMPEQQWKRWRSIFSSGFSPTHMLSQVPKIVEHTALFCKGLQGLAQDGKLFQLEEATFRLTLDVIGAVSLDAHFNYQTSENEFAERLRSIVEWTSFGGEINPFKRWNPLRPLAIWYHGRSLDKLIHAELDRRFAERKAALEKPAETGGKSVASLALDNYIKDHASAETESIDPTFKLYATAQIRMFLVAGHDTTSSAITYAFHLLYTNPTAIASIRSEHDAVLGTDPEVAGEMLSHDPGLLNQLPYTVAVIKEALRLFPPAGGIRMGSSDIVLSTEDGNRYPTADCSVWILHGAIQRDPDYWPRPEEFLPERWLVGPDHVLYPRVKGAWRPFELGPHGARLCVEKNPSMSRSIPPVQLSEVFIGNASLGLELRLWKRPANDLDRPSIRR